AASASAIARPIPDEAPQTIAVRPASPSSMLGSAFQPPLPGTRARPHPGGEEEVPPAARAERTHDSVPCLCRLRAGFGPVRPRPLRGRAEHADDLPHCRGRRLEGAPLVLAQLQLDDPLDSARPELDRHAHVQAVYSVL